VSSIEVWSSSSSVHCSFYSEESSWLIGHYNTFFQEKGQANIPWRYLYQTQKPCLSSIASENKQSSMLHPQYAYPGDDAEAISDMFSDDFMIRENTNSKILHLSPNILVWFGLAADCDIL
jgi:hypothetical protein